MVWGCLRQEIFGGNLLKEWPEARNYSIQLASINIIFIQVSQLRELIEVKEVITSYGRSGS